MSQHEIIHANAEANRDLESYKRCEQMIKQHCPILMKVGTYENRRPHVMVHAKTRSAILRRISVGQKMHSIAKLLGVSYRTVTHVKRTRKLQLERESNGAS